MLIPIMCVFFAFLLTIITKGPVALAMNRMPGGYDNHHPREQQAQLSGWGKRALAAHQNMFEAFPGFAASVMFFLFIYWVRASVDLEGAGLDIAIRDDYLQHINDVMEWHVMMCVAFVVARIIYTLLYIADVHWLRTAFWGIGFLSVAANFILTVYLLTI